MVHYLVSAAARAEARQRRRTYGWTGDRRACHIADTDAFVGWHAVIVFAVLALLAPGDYGICWLARVGARLSAREAGWLGRRNLRRSGR
jgi:hypothetical protein